MKKSHSRQDARHEARGYLEAAKEHVGALSVLYDDGRYALTMYVAGLAVECLFRAFRAKNSLPFRSDHSLDILSREAGFPDLIPRGDRVRFDSALGELILVWQNAYRFCCQSAIRALLKRRRLDRGIKGDPVKEFARRLASDAVDLVALGVGQWTN
jgi:hypothetical protein